MKPDSKIVCVGVGGEGIRFLNFRIAGKIVSGAVMEDRYIAVDTDAATLMCAWAPTRVQIGGKALLGLGTGGDMEAGRSAAEASQEVLLALFKQVKAEAAKEIRLFAGLHGGTALGAAPVVFACAKAAGICTRLFVVVGAAEEPIEKDISDLEYGGDTCE